MKKLISVYASLIILNSVSFSFVSLSEMCGEIFFNHKKWSVNKEIFKKALKDNKIPSNIFKGQTIIGLDFSGLDLTGKDFTDCRLVKVNLEDVDLTHTTFANTYFDRCNLVGAIIRYSVDSSENKSLDKVFRIRSSDHYELMKQYSDLMNEREKKEKIYLEKQTECLNHLFGALKLNLSYRDLKNFNLIDINLQDANLFDAQLSGARLSKDFSVPSCKYPVKLFDGFKKAINHDTPEKQYYLKFFNNRCDIIAYISAEELNEVNLKELNLTNIALYFSDLSGFDLEGLNITNADLSGVNFKNANLSNTTLKNVNLYMAKLQGAKFSEDFKLDNYKNPSDLFEKWYESNIKNTPDKKYYNMLVISKFNLFQDVPMSRLLDAMKENLDLRNANISDIELKDIQLSGVNLENTRIVNSSFYKSILSNINLKNSKLGCTGFVKTKLQSVNFQLSDLQSSLFNDANLQSVSFQGANLGCADFTGATLEDVDFFAADINNIKLSKIATLPDSDNDQDHIDFYYSCEDPKAKALLKIILESRGHALESKS